MVLMYYSHTMNWITTNIRFPEDLYVALKMEAARTRKSIAAVIRGKLQVHSVGKREDSNTILQEFERVAKANSRHLRGKSLSKLLINMRYEQ